VVGDFIRAQYKVATGLNIFAQLDNMLVTRETAYESGVFNPKKNFTCKAWCPVLICPHNGRNE